MTGCQMGAEQLCWIICQAVNLIYNIDSFVRVAPLPRPPLSSPQTMMRGQNCAKRNKSKSFCRREYNSLISQEEKGKFIEVTLFGLINVVEIFVSRAINKFTWSCF